jgi:hypothetical protein
MIEQFLALIGLMFWTFSVQSWAINTWSIDYELNYQAEQRQTIIDDYFVFASQFWKIKYARGCVWEYTPKRRNWEKRVWCSKNAFDCAWLMKAYGYVKGILDKDEFRRFNSRTLYELWQPIDPRTARRGDFMYRKNFWETTGNDATHFAIISRDYDWSWTLRIYDNVKPWMQDEFWERNIKVSCNRTLCYYAGKFRIYISSNGMFEYANKKWVEVQPFIVIENKIVENELNYNILITGFDYYSKANEIANKRYLSGWIDMVETMLCENWAFDPEAVWSLGEKWLCQMLPYKSNLIWLKNPNWNNIDFQASACLEKRLAVKEKSNIRTCYKIRKNYSDRIIYLTSDRK